MTKNLEIQCYSRVGNSYAVNKALQNFEVNESETTKK